MNCDSKLKDSLGKYVRGLLSKSDAEQVRKHLESCSECASQVAQIKLLLPAMEKMVKNHIPVDLLVDYHHLAKSDFSKKELLEWKLEQIEEHLLICDQCQSEIEILQNLEQEFEPVPRIQGLLSTLISLINRVYSRFSTLFEISKVRYVLAPVMGLVLVAVTLSYILFQRIVPIPKMAKPKIEQTPSTKTGDKYPLLAWVRVDKYPSSAFSSPTVTRGYKEKPEGALFSDAKEAAITELRRRVRLVNGLYEYIPPPVLGESNQKRKLLLLRLVDSTGKPIREFPAQVPLAEVTPKKLSNIVQGWLITLPSRVLYEVDMSADSVETTWYSELGDQVCVTFTYRADGGYKATPALFADLSK